MACLCAKASLLAGLSHTELYSLCISCACVHTRTARHSSSGYCGLKVAKGGVRTRDAGRSKRFWNAIPAPARENERQTDLQLVYTSVTSGRAGGRHDGFVHKDRPFPQLEGPCI